MPRVEEKLFTVKNVALAGAGLSILFILSKRRFLLNYAKKLINPLAGKQIEIIQTADECFHVINVLKRHCDDYKVLGFDCEWVTVNGTRRPVALLQLSSEKGLCALFQLRHLQKIPKPLRELLEDDDIIKVGVDPRGDAQKLSHDYGVCVTSTFDLRYLATMVKCKSEGLAKMASSILNVDLDKNWRLACSNWEARDLTDKQLHYAANDALVAVRLFHKLAIKLKARNVYRSFSYLTKHDLDDIFVQIKPYMDLPFYRSIAQDLLLPEAAQEESIEGKKTKVTKKSSKVKNMQVRGITTKPIYDNCILQAPDGHVLSTIDKSKAEWYLKKALGSKIDDDMFTVRLNFEPASRGVGDVARYYQIPKENQCVVCGRRDAYIRKNVIPREYRKHFPAVMKSHNSHDVLLLCPSCHQRSNMADLKIRHKLSEMCDAPLAQRDGGSKYFEVPELRKVKSAARALLINAERIPESRREELKSLVLGHYNESKLSDDLLIEAAYTDSRRENESYWQHGAKVVDQFQKHFGGLMELERIWREHFLTTMNPKYLPPLWDVNHNAHRLAVRATEGRVNKHDLRLAGLINDCDEEIADKIKQFEPY